MSKEIGRSHQANRIGTFLHGPRVGYQRVDQAPG